MALYEFRCGSCSEAFEEVVGAHVGTDVGSVRCPECGGTDVERLVSPVSPPSRTLTPRQKRRLEDKRGIDRGGAKQRFKQRRAAERRGGPRTGRRGNR